MSDPVDLSLQLQDDLYHTILNEASLNLCTNTSHQPKEEEEFPQEPPQPLISLN